jgi:DNA-binding XRE family transcriptional regulator
MVVTVEKEQTGVPKHNYTAVPPGAISRNLTKLREAAGMNRAELAKAADIASTSVRRFEDDYEPPSNHPMLESLATALSAKLGRDVTAELLEGGKAAEFTPFQWSRISQTWKKRRENGRTRKSKKAHSTEARVTTAPSRVKSQATASVSMRVEAQKTGLKTMEAELKKLLTNPRRLARTWAMTFNRHRMEGEEYILVPMNHFEKIFAAYLQSLKIDPKALINVNFEELFS